MRVIRLDIEYEGTDFHGYALQRHQRTVGGEIDGALTRILGEPIRTVAGARTDAGVHARGQVASFGTRSDMAVNEMRRALNALVGKDVAVNAVTDADPGFDARRAARSRRYEYAIWNAAARSVWDRRSTWHIGDHLDVPAMEAACQQLIGKHDFASFRTHRTQDDANRSTVRRVLCSNWRRDEATPIIRFQIEADGFLRHMVRTIVGSAVLVGKGDLPVDAVEVMLARGERAAAGPTAPPQGLTLMEVTY
jgi:tRNA pseudouridine38-40 synthase